MNYIDFTPEEIIECEAQRENDLIAVLPARIAENKELRDKALENELLKNVFKVLKFEQKNFGEL